jgi:iron(III) transport system substrate-binding protein
MKLRISRHSVAPLVMISSMLLLACSSPAPAAPTAKPAAPAPAPAAPPAPAAAPAASPAAQPATASSPAAAAQPVTKVASPAASSGAAWDQIVEAARKEKTLSLTTEAGTDYQKLGEFMQKQLPYLSIEHTAMRPSDFVPRAIAEQRNGQFLWDMAFGPASNMFGVMTPGGNLESIKPFLQSLTPDVTDNSKWAGGFETYPDPARPETFVYQYVKSGGIFVNRERVSAAEFSSTEQLIDPKWKGKIAVYNPAQSTGGSQTLGALLVSKGETFIQKLFKDQEMVQIETQRQATEFVATGRYPIVIGANRTILQEYQTQGVGTKIERIDQDSLYLHSYGVSIPKNPPHPNVVRVALNWFLSQEGQDAWASTVTDANTRRVDVKIYNPDTTPDYKNIDQYKFRVVTLQGNEVLAKIFALAKG